MISFYLVWTLCYFVLLGWIARKWPQQEPKTDRGTEVKSVTLLIPFRNERKRVSRLIRELGKIEYPSLEILLIDDHSEDGSFSFFKSNLIDDSPINVLQSSGMGKKSALEFGVNQAKGELILCSDADCEFPKDWVWKMIEPFSNPEVQLVAGPVMTSEDKTFFHRFQQIEWASILMVTQLFFFMKKPQMCSGANLAYRKSAFLKVGGYDQNRQYLSGDDEFLLKKIEKQFGPSSCVYLPFSSALVKTQAQADFSQLLNQRIRWAGKWRMHRDFGHAFSAIFPFLVQVLWLASGALFWLGWEGVFAFALIWIGKITAEKLSLGKVLATLGVNPSVWDFFRASLAHPFYVISVGLGSIRGKFNWKGRTN